MALHRARATERWRARVERQWYLSWGKTSQLILPVLENVHPAFRNLFSDPTLIHIILQYIIFLQCYRESYRLLYAYKNSQWYTRRKSRDLSAFCCHNICGTLMCIPGIERYKCIHKRAPRSSRAIHCTQASRKQVSIHNALRQECEVVYFFENASLAFSYIHGPNMSHIKPEVRYVW